MITYTLWLGQSPVIATDSPDHTHSPRRSFQVSQYTMTQGATPHHFTSLAEAVRVKQTLPHSEDITIEPLDINL